MTTSSDEPSRGYDFAAMALSDMVRLAAELRTAAEQAGDFTSAAVAVVHRLREGFRKAGGPPALPLVRLFTTRRFDDLPGDLRHVVRGQLAEPPPPGLRCLTLEASAGVTPDQDGAHPPDDTGVLPLASTEAVAAAPLVSALVGDLGVEPAELVEGTVSDRRRFGVFHVAEAAGSDRVPHQRFVRAQGIRSVLGFGGGLPGGDVFCVVMFSREPIGAETAELFRAVAVSVRAGLLTQSRHGEVSVEAQRDALREHLLVLEESLREQAYELETAVRRSQAEAALVDTLQVVGQRLTAQLDLDTLVQDATDAATSATQAAFGAFFYNLVDQYGESYTLYTIAGVPREAFARFPMPRNTAVFAQTFNGVGTFRSDDITKDPRYGHNTPYRGMPAGHLPVCSYLAVPVISPSSREVLGGFFFGHPDSGRFTARHQQLAEGIAGYTAIALDNARLFDRQRSLATELARSMQPIVPDVAHLEIASSYLPAAVGSEVGGDWFDVIELAAGRTAFVIGDVVGRGVTAAAIMGQIRTAVRSYALLDLPPADLLRHVSHLADTTVGATFITCFYAVHDPADQTLTFANAGHLPAVLISPDGEAELIGAGLGMPLGVGDAYAQDRASFAAGARLTLYTDGLVESRERGFTSGLETLVRELRSMPDDLDPQQASAGLIDRLTGGRHEDDVALLHVRHLDGQQKLASVALGNGHSAGAEARAFVRERLAEWHLTDVVETALTVTTELVSNAILHTRAPGRLRLHHTGRRLTIDVTDHGGTVPRLVRAGDAEEHHRGLHLVNAFAARWGTRPTADGKAVWAVIPTP